MSSNEKMLFEVTECRKRVETRLDQLLPIRDGKYATLIEAMRYSLLDGGKRIRAIICMKFCEAVCGSVEKALPAACAVEMLHAYTLIHDDLPCMDNDEMRRGKPSNHIKYGEFTATLAGDALQAMVFQTLLNSDLDSGTIVQMAQIIAETAGPHGVCAGQYLDLSVEGKELTVDELMEIYSLKTSALFCAAARLGVLAGGGTQTQLSASAQYARLLGLAFQTRDDILDCIGSEEVLGKPIGSDNENKKTTLASVLGIEECERLCNKLTNGAIEVLESGFDDNKFLIELTLYLCNRMK